MARRSWQYNETSTGVVAVEVATEHEPSPFGGTHKSQAEIYGDTRTADGKHDISSPTKLRSYLRDQSLRTGKELTMADDFKETWKNADKERIRQRLTPGAGSDKQMSADIGRAAYQVLEKERRQRRREGKP